MDTSLVYKLFAYMVPEMRKIMFFALMCLVVFFAYALLASASAAAGAPGQDMRQLAATAGPSSWARSEIELAKGAGLILDNMAYDYTGAITREQFCELLVVLYEKLAALNASSKDQDIDKDNDKDNYNDNDNDKNNDKNNNNDKDDGNNVNLYNPTYGISYGDAASGSASMGAVFKDTANPAVLYAYGLGLVNGVSADEFAPASKITRQEICAMLVRCIDKAEHGADISYYKVYSFADSSKISDWAKPYVNYAYDYKIMAGVSQGTIAPLDNVTCEQAILLTYRAYANRSSYIVSSAPFGLVDGHADTITAAMDKNQNMYQNNLHVDFKRLGEYKAPVQIFAIWCADRYVANAYEYANSAIDFFEHELAAHSDIIELALSMDDLERNARNGKISAILMLEGAEPLAGKLENLEHFYERGVRLITLTWNRENELGYGAAASGANQGKGLKPFGVECVKRMEELGIIVDVSHLNEAGFWDVDKISSRPYMASHSNAYSVTDNARNLKDTQIEAIVKKGGIIGLNLYPGFLIDSPPGTARQSADTSNVTVDNIIKHIDHFISLGADDNIGLGCDFDGISAPPQGIKDISSLKILEQEISNQFGKRISSQIMHDNYYDFFKRYFV